MRILQVRFQNLNSLTGEWTIDLTHPSFTGDGIFAITGPTGAGKTTILDAICLALYGRTPRLAKVTKSVNEIMSRQTGECFAEVTFETQSGRYRCHWSQHRARKKSDGDLQAPRHEIADADSGKIVETKIRGVADQIEAATGMDFDRFTRSMLLAQGGFAAFLQAAPDERAPILEQITGTEIYSQISIRVHERRSEERHKLDAFQIELDGMELLCPEEEIQLGQSLKEKNRQETDLNLQIAQKNQAISWLDGIAQLENDLKKIAEAKHDLQLRQEEFAPESERLRRANQALELVGDYATLTSLRRALKDERDNHDACLKVLPEHEDAAKQAEEALTAATGHLDDLRTQQKETAPTIRKVRELDLTIEQKDEQVKSTKDILSEAENSLTTLRKKHKDDGAALDGKRKNLDGLLTKIEESRADEGLVEHLAGICGRFDVAKNLKEQLDGKREESKVAEDQLTKTFSVLKKQTENLQTQKQLFEDHQGTLRKKQLELKNILEKKELSDWRQELSALTEEKSRLANVIEWANLLNDSTAALKTLDKRNRALKAEKSDLASWLEAQVEKQHSLEREEGLLETQLSLLTKIENFEEARVQLQDGKPCPLCGAKEHPFAEGNVPVPGETQQRLATVRADLKKTTVEVNKLQVRQAQVDKDLERVAAELQENAERITQSKDLIRQSCADLPLVADDPDLNEKLKGLQGEKAIKLDRANQVVQTAEALEKKITILRNVLETFRETLAEAQAAAQDAGHKKESAEKQLERLKTEGDALRLQLENSLNRLGKDISAYGAEAISFENLDQIQEQLTARRTKWLSRQATKLELEQQIADLEAQTLHHSEQIKKSDEELNRHRELLANLQRERKKLQGERRNLFGDKNPDDEEQQLTAAIEAAEQALDASRKKSAAASQEHTTLKTRIKELQTSIDSRSTELKPAEEVFQRRLEELGFANEDVFQTAQLREDERKDLALRTQKLANEKVEMATREREKTTQLETERDRQVTDQSRDEIAQALETLIGTQREVQQEIGGIRQRLKTNESLKQKQRERVQAIDAQKKECSRWDLLHQLIGSADGKKYRNFAQGLTFEMMIGHANRQLQKMTDRYLLIRNEAQPLELNVIDNYQAGEIRSTKNLSGGESFIVSLALALGLSHMASQNVRVDSLFLDEGFGTLDEEALDIALETLAGLQQDGKLIGVISHVQALKERISTQIQVIPQTGGRSAIFGAGCEGFAS